jgi:hypothetical protein
MADLRIDWACEELAQVGVPAYHEIWEIMMGIQTL